MKILHWLAAPVLCALLAACGGGGGSAGTSPFSTSSSLPATSNATAIDVLANSVQVGSGGDTTTIQAIVKGPGNVSLAGAPVTFSTDTGTLTKAASATDPSGVATATFAAGANRANRTATIRVVSGTASGQVLIDIAGTKLSYAGATTVPLGGAVPVSIKAVDSTGAAVSGLQVSVASALGNGLSATAVTTDATGNGTVTYTASNAGTDTLTFSGGGTSVTPQIIVSAANFSFASPAANTQIPVGSNQALVVTYLVNGAPQANKTITFTSTAGNVTSSAITNAQGQASATISSTTASPAIVQASVSGGSVQATLPVVFIAQTPGKIVLQVSPTAISPNTAGSTTQQATLRATVTDANANPVSGATVDFTALQDPSGGRLSQASAVTDTSGQASVQYIAGANPTSAGGVQLQATVGGTCTPVFVGACTGTANLTVNGSALFIALGTGNTISNVDPQTYQKDYVVYVTDANGNAVQGADVTMSVIPTRYGKGNLVFSGSWVYSSNVIFCANEDATFENNPNPALAAFAFNGVLDAGEDFNGSGKLEPGNVISLSPGRVTTNAQGRATVSLFYAESYAPWVEVKLKAQANVSGTESSTFTIFTVNGLSTDFTSATNPPAGVVSPFGINACDQPN